MTLTEQQLVDIINGLADAADSCLLKASGVTVVEANTAATYRSKAKTYYALAKLFTDCDSVLVVSSAIDEVQR